MNIDYITELNYISNIDIESKDYWKLSEEEKNNLTNSIISQVFVTLKKDIDSVPVYLRLLDERIKFSEYHQEFELAEVYRRISKRLISF